MKCRILFSGENERNISILMSMLSIEESLNPVAYTDIASSN